MNLTADKDTVLNVSGISKRFGGLQALTDVGITIQRGQVYGLIGPNGAGKTTFFNVITGLYTPDSGTFELAGKPYQPIADMVHELLGAEGIMVGDRPDTDGRFALTLGWRFALVLTGVTSQADLPVEPQPDLVAESLHALVSEALSGRELDK